MPRGLASALGGIHSAVSTGPYGGRTHMRSSIEVAEEIQRRIQSGRYLPGDPLSQYELAQEFNISRTPVREALRLLEARRIIALSSSGRAMVAVPSARSIRETFQIRAELEGLAAQLAVDWLQDSDLESLRRHQDLYALTLRERIQSERGSQWRSHNQDFHILIAQASHNARLHDMIQELQGGGVASVLSFASKMPPRLMEDNIQQHEDIIQALTARNGQAARDAMVEHVHQTMRLVIDWMQED